MRVFLRSAAFFSILLLVSSAFAQHCPYDGAEMVVVHVANGKGEPVERASMSLKLVEVDSPDSASCQRLPGPLTMSFREPADAFAFRYRSMMNVPFESLCRDCKYNAPGYYGVVLGQDERHCFVSDENGSHEKRSFRRKWEVVFEDKDKTHTIPVPADRIYSLCTGSGEWSRIIPVEIKVNEDLKQASDPELLVDLIPDPMPMGFF